ncbi:hypothetical protein [Fimbriiglobus ruber]|uniref:Carboxypeptidase regulatory-like domain-containing protein n=1 Tax=Fimbriiglobus ruber TaxID=1908690 RepID=A0A225DBB5_9BACT|nr:hypothetical protein [Fimbriiglobus ruber]OWK36944.1 hypothetical protein FRUB_07866 [Fimbriiglobus ruber]
MVVFVGLAGCGGDVSEKTADVKGKLLKGGQPYKLQRPSDRPLPPGDPGMRLRFVRVEGPNPSEASFAKLDVNTGEFTAPGPNGKGLPPGKYQVSVYAGAMGETPPPGAKAAASGPPNPWGTEVYKKEIDIPASGLSDLVIDVDKK